MAKNNNTVEVIDADKLDADNQEAGIKKVETDEKTSEKPDKKLEAANKKAELAAQKLKEKERLDKINAWKAKHYADIFEADRNLAIRQKLEEKTIKKEFIRSILLMVSIVGLPLGIIKLLKNIKRKKIINNPYQIQKIIIIEEAEKKHKERNARIVDAYKSEKKRIKQLKKLPFKILNHINFLISMFLIIIFFFVLDVGIAPTALVLFSAFTFCYFLIGILMHLVFYMISENKTREKMIRLEEEKNRLLAEEKMKSEEQIRVKLNKERRVYEEKERLRLEEERLRKEETARRLREEKERKEKEELEARMLAEAEAELKELTEQKEKLIQEKRMRLIKGETKSKPTKAELAQEKERLRNEFDKNILAELNEKFVVPDVSGIERFGDIEKMREEYGGRILFDAIDDDENSVISELDNTILKTTKLKVEESEDITDFDTADIEEAKTQIFRKARKVAGKENDNKENENTPSAITNDAKEKINDAPKVENSVAKVENPASNMAEDMEIIVNETKRMINNTKKTNGNGVSGKSFMVIKEMLKDG